VKLNWHGWDGTRATRLGSRNGGKEGGLEERMEEGRESLVFLENRDRLKGVGGEGGGVRLSQRKRRRKRKEGEERRRKLVNPEQFGSRQLPQD
jgi:hypothetical protein